MTKVDTRDRTAFAECEVEVRQAGTQCAVCGVEAELADVAQIRVSNPADPGATFACLGKCADMLPCYVCGWTFGHREDGRRTEDSDPSLTPYERMRAVAKEADVEVLDVPADVCGDEFAGYVAVGFTSDGEIRGLIGLAEDLDDDLRADVVAFGLATFVGDLESITTTKTGGLGIGRVPLPTATRVGHLAWHMVRSSGRYARSTTFELIDLGVSQRSAAIAA